MGMEHLLNRALCFLIPLVMQPEEGLNVSPPSKFHRCQPVERCTLGYFSMVKHSHSIVP